MILRHEEFRVIMLKKQEERGHVSRPLRIEYPGAWYHAPVRSLFHLATRKRLDECLDTRFRWTDLERKE